MTMLDRNGGDPEALIGDLLARWEDSYDRGEEVDVRVLCGDRPDLVEELSRRIEALGDWDRFTDTVWDLNVGPRPARGPRVPLPESALITLSLEELRFHAQGGLGVLCTARDPRLGRELAVKIAAGPSGMFSEAEINRRFLREVRVTAALEHPGIVPVHGLGQDSQGRLCYAMRLIAGKTLGKAIAEFHAARRTGPPRRRRDLRRDAEFRALLQRLKSACVTVAYAHSRGFLHRDLKPDHILLGDFDSTLVVDWGLTKAMTDMESTPVHPTARAAERREPFTDAGLGTLGFASPEQQAGDWSRVGPTSDVYSLGAILYVLLTNRPPFTGSSVGELLRLVECGAVPPPRKHNPEIPEALEAICLKAMALRPEDRFPSAQALADDLERWLADSPVEAFREPLAVRFRRSIERHSLLLLTLLVAGGGVTAATIAWHWAQLRRVELNTLAYATAEASAREQTMIRQAGWVSSGLDHIGRARVIATSIRSESALRSLAVSCLEGTDLRQIGSFTSMPVGCLAFSPDGKRIAAGELFGTGACRVQLIDAETLATVAEQSIHAPRQAGERPGVSCLAFSPGGQWLAGGLRDGRVLIWPASGALGEPREVENYEPRAVAVGFTPDGRYLVSASRGGQVTLAEWTSDAAWSVIRRVQVSEGLEDLVISPDGLRVVCVGGSGVFSQDFALLREPGTAEFLRRSEDSTDRVAFSPDGLSLALPSHKLMTLTIGPDPSPDGMVDTDLGVAHQEETNHVEFSPDGSLIATGSSDNTVKVWDVASRRMVLRLPVFSESLVYPVFDPSGRLMAIGTSEGAALYEVLGSDTCRTRAIGSGEVAEFAFLPTRGASDAPELAILRSKAEPSSAGGKTLELWAGPGLRPARTLNLPGSAVLGEARWALEASPTQPTVALNLLPVLSLHDLGPATSSPMVLGHPATVPVAFSADGQALWLIARPNTLISVGSADGKERTRWRYRPPKEPRGRVSIECLSAGRENVVAGTLAGWILIGETGTGRLRLLARASSPVESIALSPDESSIACGTQRGGLELFAVRDGSLVLRRDPHAERIEQVRFHPSGHYLATLARDGKLILWQVEGTELREVLRITPAIRRTPSMFRFSSDGRHLGVLMPRERGVRVWDLEHLRRKLKGVELDWDGHPCALIR